MARFFLLLYVRWGPRDPFQRCMPCRIVLITCVCSVLTRFVPAALSEAVRGSGSVPVNLSCWKRLQRGEGSR